MGQAFCVCSRSVIVVQEKRYLLIDKLGEGGFSYVDLVEGLHDGHFYALKRIICHDKESKHVALSEAHAHQLFQHPNVLPLVGTREMDKAATCEVWLLLPYHQKGTLWDELERLRDKGSVMEEEHISQILHGICSGLKAIHDRGYAHRDMKPTNVLLTNDDKPVIMDLGSMGKAKIEVNGSREAMAIQDWAAERCTISYRAPELFSVENHCIIDEKADIWSLGCVLYAMMFLEGPFDAIFQKGDSVALAVQNSIAIPNSCRYSRYLQDLLTSMMVVNGAERPAVAQILSTLDRWPMSTNNPMV